MQKIKNLVQFAFENFGPLTGFSVANHFFGFKAAVITSLGIVAIEVALLVRARKKSTFLFVLTTTVAIVFGLLDLALDSPTFFKFEAPLINLLLAFSFGITLFREKSMIQEIAENQGRVPTSERSPEDFRFFFQLYTAAWVLYFLAKAAAFLWINLHNTLEQGFLIRLALGNLSFWAMLFFSIGLPRQVWNLLDRWQVFPSQKQGKPSSKVS